MGVKKLTSEINRILLEFLRDIERAEHLLNLIKNLRDFGASSTPPSISNGTIDWNESITLKAAAAKCRTDLPIYSGSLLMYLTGRFEYFVKQTIQAAAEIIISRSNCYSELSGRIKKELRQWTFEVFQRPARYGYTETQADLFVIDLASNLSNTSQQPKVSAEVLTFTDTNMNSTAISDLVKRIGMNDIWAEIGKQAKIKRLMEVTTDKDSSTRTKSRLDALMDERNQIAHPTDATNFPDPDQVLKSADFIKTLSTVLADIICVNLTPPTPSP